MAIKYTESEINEATAAALKVMDTDEFKDAFPTFDEQIVMLQFLTVSYLRAKGMVEGAGQMTGLVPSDRAIVEYAIKNTYDAIAQNH